MVTQPTGETRPPRLKVPELLAPAGSFEKMRTAIHYGADAVYCGGRKFSLRAHATNFSEEELGEAAAYARDHGVKLYVTVNIFAHESDLHGLEKYLHYLAAIGADGIIVSDPGILMLARQTVPTLPIHLSTQANVTNPANARFWEGQGVKRLNLARELSLAEIGAIRRTLDPATAIEIFVHGALCISYSGRCLLSCYFTGRDANRGTCAHPCRYRYVLQEEKRPGQYFPVEEDSRGTYIFNSRDLCLLNRLPQLVRCGVDSLKIEGRMKSTYYVGSVVRVYRAALDYIMANFNKAAGDTAAPLPPVFMEELQKTGTRDFTENFIAGPPDHGAMLYDRPRSAQEYVPAAMITERQHMGAEDNCYALRVMSPLKKQDRLEYLGRDIKGLPLTVTELMDSDGAVLDQAHPGTTGVLARLEPAPATPFAAGCLLRKKK